MSFLHQSLTFKGKAERNLSTGARDLPEGLSQLEVREVSIAQAAIGTQDCTRERSKTSPRSLHAYTAPAAIVAVPDTAPNRKKIRERPNKLTLSSRFQIASPLWPNERDKQNSNKSETSLLEHTLLHRDTALHLLIETCSCPRRSCLAMLNQQPCQQAASEIT